ncbi:MAG: Ig-like domain-containing protein [Muribaculaceae bacterium]|nr:Ig-like domain-containing protein [Muribaculaceae bacterium]
MKSFYHFLPVMLLLILTAFTETSTAQIKDGEATVIQGNTVTVSIGAAYQTTLNRATGINYSWTAGSSAISIQSKTNKACTIKGNTVGTAKLNYHCSYYIDGYYRTMDFYYDITIKANTILVTRIEMTPSSATLDVGHTLQLSTVAYPSNATVRSLNFSTENYSVASVSTSGLVTALGAGTVKVWARAKDGSGAGNYCIVTVKEPTKVSSIELSEYERIMEPDKEFSLTAVILPEDANNRTVEWTSDNYDVATVNNGLVRAVGVGSCLITCGSTDGSDIKASCRITVNEPEKRWLSIILPNGSISIDVSEMEDINLKLTPDEGYLLHSLSIDGEEQTIDGNSIYLTIPKLESNSIVNAVFADEVSTYVDNIENDINNYHVSVFNKLVSVSGLSVGDIVKIYSSNGSLVKITNESKIELNTPGIYILRIGSHSFKFAI